MLVESMYRISGGNTGSECSKDEANRVRKKKPKLKQGTLGFLYRAKDKSSGSGDGANCSGAIERKVLAGKRDDNGVRTVHSSLLRNFVLQNQGSFDEDSEDGVGMILPEKPVQNFKNLADKRSFRDAEGQLVGTVADGDECVNNKPAASTVVDLTRDEKIVGEGTDLQPQQLPVARKLAGISDMDHASVAHKQASVAGAGYFPVSTTRRLKMFHKKQSSSTSNSSEQKRGALKLTKEQVMVMDLILKERLNVFYTGSAGTGKSILLRELVKALRAKYGASAVAVTASTGLAAVSIGGTTVNRFSGIGIGAGVLDKLVERAKKKKEVFERWKRTRVLIIDEISMIDGRFLDKLDYVARSLRKNADVPFGGIQLVFTGDFFQLPPVSDRNPNSPKPLFCFESKAWQQGIQKTICLQRIFRQKDNDLIDLLNAIRFGEVTPQLTALVRTFEREVHYPDGIEPTELFPTRKEVDTANKRRLERLPGFEVTYEALDSGDVEKKFSSYFDAIIAERTLVLKENTQVMMLKNKDDTLVNGTVGRVLFFTTANLWNFIQRDHINMLDNAEFVMDMKLVCKAIGVPENCRPLQLQQEINSRPILTKSYLHQYLTLAQRESSDLLYPLVRFSVSNKYRYELIQREEFLVDLPINGHGVGEGSRHQIPLVPCWALSIHKAQGQTIDRLKVDLRRIFEAGQVYVALSRAVSKDQLQIVNFNPKRIKADPKVKQFYQNLITTPP
ncbi:DNA helicase Ecym_7362 [Eremothecium cymbalariae DBVPG|uniref:ATP-dependent DNA helicase RRM3 n=1 Tax=Eremothecium cymbalariae (strain CBS 270.75 / DBVPG 7215 / KCTC 17166 / NRRL Y-17582) TaxID=931890 RepID=G8JWH4_ERECY|nr:hypothetical protein Ecym_7362 [Eremothecium cymbalariae DBVPG\